VASAGAEAAAVGVSSSAVAAAVAAPPVAAARTGGAGPAAAARSGNLGAMAGGTAFATVGGAGFTVVVAATLAAGGLVLGSARVVRAVPSRMRIATGGLGRRAGVCGVLGSCRAAAAGRGAGALSAGGRTAMARVRSGLAMRQTPAGSAASVGAITSSIAHS
jgi:hypothetical protein